MNASPTNAYWGLYWSDGKSGKWTYSSSGVGGTSVPNGGFLAFSWQNGGSADPPGAAPVNSKPAPATKAPTKTATKAPTKKAHEASRTRTRGRPVPTRPSEATPDQPTKTQEAAGASPQEEGRQGEARTCVEAGKAKAKAKASASASASSSASESAAADPSDEASPDATSAEQVDSAFAPEEEQGGLPVWVPVVVILALAGAAGGTAWWRRRTGAP